MRAAEVQRIDSREHPVTAHLLRDEAEALLRTDEFVRLAQQGVEGFAGALGGCGVPTDGEASHMDQPLIAASRIICSLDTRQKAMKQNADICRIQCPRTAT